MATIVQSPFLMFFDRSGNPLEDGYIYIGLANTNPESNPQTVYWDDSLTVTAAQPIRTLAGYASRNGSPSNIYASIAPYSIVVRDRDGTLVYSDLSFSVTDAAQILSNIAALRLLSEANIATQAMLGSNYAAGDGGGIFRYDATDISSLDNGGTIIVDASGRRWKRQFDGVYQPEFFGDCSTASGFTAALIATIIAAGQNARITIPNNKTLTAQITLLTAQVLQGRDGRSIIYKGFNGDMIDMSAAQCGLEDLHLRGVGATYTGRGVIITATNNYQYMENVWIYDTVGFALEFTVSNAGGNFRAERCTFQRTTATNSAIGLPTALDTVGARRFINCSADGGWFLKFNSGINTWIVGCDFVNLDFTASDGVSLRAVVSGCRIATGGAALAVYGNDSSITGNVVAGPGTLNGAASRNQILGNVMVGAWTDSSTATGTNINIIPGKGTATNDNAAAGNIGEYLSASISTSIALVTDTNTNVVSLTLSPGDWDVSGVVNFVPSGTTTLERLLSSIGFVSATPNLASFEAFSDTPYPVGYTPRGTALAQSVGPHRVSLATATTYYLVVYTKFAASTLNVGGILRARRMR